MASPSEHADDATYCCATEEASSSHVNEGADVYNYAGIVGNVREAVADSESCNTSQTPPFSQHNSCNEFAFKSLNDEQSMLSTPVSHRMKRRALYIGGAVVLLLFIVVVDLVVSAMTKGGSHSRGQLRTSTSFKTPATIKFSSCADDDQWVYVDGKLLDFRDKVEDAFRPINVIIPAGTSVIGVKVRNSQGDAGWGGFFSNGMVTEARLWRCTTDLQMSDHWTLSDYDDSDWIIPAHKSWYTCGTHPDNVQWLWTDDTFASNLRKTIYCRASIA